MNDIPSTHIAYRAQLLTFRADPLDDENAVCYYEDGLLWVAHGRVVKIGAYAEIKPRLPQQVQVCTYSGKLIMPGLIDTHIHYPQTDIIASPAHGLLQWLDTYTFPAEQQFVDAAHSRQTARFFLAQLLAAGTTTALVYGTVHPQSVDAFFAESHALNLRMIAGKVLMDRHCPAGLRDSAESGYTDSEKLITRWHGTGRQHYALTPRFAPTSSEAQLDACGTLARKYPTTFIQSHLAETLDEVKWVAKLFPSAGSYLDVYARHGLLRHRSVYGHCIYLNDTDRAQMAEVGALAAHCPTSNLFLGSGLFDLNRADALRLPVALATDIGGGTSFSMLQTMNEAYKVARMTGYSLNALRMFYLATTGAARALALEDKIGTLAAGTEADFIVLDPAATPLLARRTARAESLTELLFAFAMLGDDRAVYATYSAGQCQHRRDQNPHSDGWQ